MSDKKMSAKWFVSLASRSAVPASALISAHREWLENGELASETSSILEKLDAGVSPNLSLESLCAVAADHMLRQIEAAGLAEKEPASRSFKPYQAVIRDSLGNVVLTQVNGKEKELRAGFDSLQFAERWTQRRLSEVNDKTWTADITCVKCLNKLGQPIVFTTSRDAAIKALAPKKKSPLMRERKGSGGFSNSKVSVHPTRAQFSRG